MYVYRSKFSAQECYLYQRMQNIFSVRLWKSSAFEFVSKKYIDSYHKKTQKVKIFYYRNIYQFLNLFVYVIQLLRFLNVFVSNMLYSVDYKILHLWGFQGLKNYFSKS